MEIIGIEWDNANRAKCQKHGVSVAQIEAFITASPRIAPDLKHSGVEKRLIATGMNSEGRSMFIVFTLRDYSDGCWLRPISARFMLKKEANAYETQSTDL